MSICVHLQNHQWSTNQCSLIDSNATHSICSCRYVSTIAVLIQFQKVCFYSFIRIDRRKNVVYLVYN